MNAILLRRGREIVHDACRMHRKAADSEKAFEIGVSGCYRACRPLDVSERQESSAQRGSAGLQFVRLIEAAFPPAGRKLLLAACRQEHNAANERHGACDRLPWPGCLAGPNV